MEILGSNLKKFFDTVDNSQNDAEITYAGNKYEVWEVSDKLYKKMCDMSEDEFVELAGKDAWWRSCKGSILGVPDTEFEINGESLLGWKSDDDYGTRKYSDISKYLCECIGASQPYNVCACAMDLAKYNNMTMAELFEKYGE